MSRALLAAFLVVMASAAAARAGDPLIDPPRASRLADGLVVTGHVLPVDTAGRVVGNTDAHELNE